MATLVPWLSAAKRHVALGDGGGGKDRSGEKKSYPFEAAFYDQPFEALLSDHHCIEVGLFQG